MKNRRTAVEALKVSLEKDKVSHEEICDVLCAIGEPMSNQQLRRAERMPKKDVITAIKESKIKDKHKDAFITALK